MKISSRLVINIVSNLVSSFLVPQRICWLVRWLSGCEGGADTDKSDKV